MHGAQEAYRENVNYRPERIVAFLSLPSLGWGLVCGPDGNGAILPQIQFRCTESPRTKLRLWAKKGRVYNENSTVSSRRRGNNPSGPPRESDSPHQVAKSGQGPRRDTEQLWQRQHLRYKHASILHS